MRKILIIILLLMGLLPFVGCSPDEQAVKVDLSKKEQVNLRESSDVITYAYLPQYSHTVSYQRHHLLVEYLRRETGLNIKQIFPDTFEQHIKMVGQGKIDISYSNPFIYVKIAHRYGARAFARIVEVYNQESFCGQIICRADNPHIKTISDCRGKSWIAVDSTSAGGYLYALGYFAAHGIQKTDFSEISFAPGPGGKQEGVVLAVYAGKYDIGTIREGTLNVVADKIDTNEIRIIAKTPLYPSWVYAAREGLDSEIVKKIKTAMLKLEYNQKEHKHILEAAHFTKMISSVDHDFVPVKKLAALVGIRLEE
ncbi:MAG: phosphate/phosphite/phosphonate ABC transporter substrate-binding protein [Desulfobacteraceae bacterium]|nr:phosphate/phosphite/phosphonate ABC transporter substrate-binding protein [Desulfobacteraceae bacterium]MBC2756807.1 phosphate/phosphite/phosphonate ABC transporter substrate-binding protein [Desulfobacteraceae bacterium]